MQTSTPSPTTPIQVLGTAFVEFTSVEREPLLHSLTSVGFRQVARHRTKDIVLLQQGEMYFVVNSEPASHAQRFARRHGASCAGMAFLVDDAAHAMEVALSLSGERLEQGGGESLLPGLSLTGIGGSALYLVDHAAVDELWAQFLFDSPQRARQADVRLQRVDHLTHCVHPGAMAKWVDFYKRLFGFEEVFKFVAGDASNGFDTVAVRDPLNNACVTVLEPMGAKSQIQEFIDEYHGEGIQHLALLSDDLYQSVERMRDNGVEFLPTPKAYYDAVDSRLPGHGEDLSRMQRLGMLIDGAAAGENPNADSRILLQIFTRKMIGPIFFEAIQRKGNRGFGEGNARALFEAIKREQEAAAVSEGSGTGIKT